MPLVDVVTYPPMRINPALITAVQAFPGEGLPPSLWVVAIHSASQEAPIATHCVAHDIFRIIECVVDITCATGRPMIRISQHFAVCLDVLQVILRTTSGSDASMFFAFDSGGRAESMDPRAATEVQARLAGVIPALVTAQFDIASGAAVTISLARLLAVAPTINEGQAALHIFATPKLQSSTLATPVVSPEMVHDTLDEYWRQICALPHDRRHSFIRLPDGAIVNRETVATVAPASGGASIGPSSGAAVFVGFCAETTVFHAVPCGSARHAQQTYETICQLVDHGMPDDQWALAGVSAS